MSRNRSAWILSLCLVLAQTGCVTLLPKASPVRLYRFGDAPRPSDSQDISNAAKVTTHLPSASSGDQLLTLTGREAAYVRGARWVSPAAELFQAAAVQAFRNAPLPTSAGRRVMIEVTAFELDLAPPDKGPPRVRIDADVTILGPGDGATRTSHFATLRPVRENTMASIAEVFDKSVFELLKFAVKFLED